MNVAKGLLFRVSFGKLDLSCAVKEGMGGHCIVKLNRIRSIQQSAAINYSPVHISSQLPANLGRTSSSGVGQAFSKRATASNSWLVSSFGVDSFDGTCARRLKSACRC